MCYNLSMSEKLPYNPVERIRDMNSDEQIMDRLDMMIERQNERLRQRESGRKALEAANRPSPEEMYRRRVAVGVQEAKRLASIHGDDTEQKLERMDRLANMQNDDPDQYWRDVMAQVAEERYGEDKDNIKFYYSTSFENLQKMLQGDKLVSQDANGNPFNSEIKLSADYKENGKWKSGFASERDAQSDEITLVFDGNLLKDGGFIPLGDNPLLSSVDLKKTCLGLVWPDRRLDGKVQKFLRQNELDLPCYHAENGDDKWSERAYSAELLRQNRDKAVTAGERRREHEAELRDQVFDNVDKDAADKLTKRYADRMSRKDVAKLLRKYNKLNKESKRRVAEQAVAEYCAVVLDLEHPVRVQYINDPAGKQAADYRLYSGSRGIEHLLTVNRAKFSGDNVMEILEVLGHESWHAKQRESQLEWLDSSRRSRMSAEDQKRAEAYEWNSDHFIKPDVDYAQYRAQLLEVEANQFSQKAVATGRAAAKYLAMPRKERVAEKFKRKKKK